MAKLFRLGPTPPLQVGDVIFDVLAVIGTMGGVWLWIRDPILRIDAEFFLVMTNIFGVYFYHRHRKDLPLDRFWTWFVCLTGGAVITIISSGLDHRWWGFTVLFLSGDQAKAMRILDTNPPANFFMCVGLACAYIALFNLIRVAFIRLFKTSDPSSLSLSTGNSDKED